MNYRLLDEKSQVFRGVNPHDVSDYISQNVSHHHIRLPDSMRDEAGLCHQKVGVVDLCRVSYGGQVRVVTPGLGDSYHLQIILSGHCSYTIRGQSFDFGPGDVMLMNPHDAVDLTYSADCEKFILRIPATLLDDVCAEHRWYKPRDGIEFIPVRYRFDEIESLMNLVSLLCVEAETSAGTPQMYGHYNRVVASKLLTLMKHNLSLDLPCLQSGSFDRISDYIEENIKQDIGVDELARVARMSLRSLYLLFERYVKTTPKCYIKQRKLQKVHAVLTDPSFAVPNVTAVALDYGFTHLGRFSECYKAAFGVLPSDSLKRR
jgi:AraC-like DNA-binding protein